MEYVCVEALRFSFPCWVSTTGTSTGGLAFDEVERIIRQTAAVSELARTGGIRLSN